MQLTGFVHFLLTGQPISAKETESVRAEVSFAEAIEAHLNWKRELIESLNGSRGNALVPWHAGNPSICVLGKWIDDAGTRRYGDLSSFEDLREVHRRFHALARQVIELRLAKDMEAAQALLRTDFEQASSQIVQRLRHLAKLFGN